jgi:DNA invertase Pin-like site-specific DNA recombinase
VSDRRPVKTKERRLQVIAQKINTGDATGRLLFNMLRAIAQFEPEIRAERQIDDITKENAKACSLENKRN